MKQTFVLNNRHEATTSQRVIIRHIFNARLLQKIFPFVREINVADVSLKLFFFVFQFYNYMHYNLSHIKYKNVNGN